MSLLACPECSRHIRTNETECPFCGADVGNAMATAMPRPIPRERMSRAAMMAFAAASLGAASCGGDTKTSAGNLPLTDAGTDGANMTGTGGLNAGTGGVSAATGGQIGIPIYGAPFPSNGGAAGAAGAGTSTGGLIGTPVYGAPFPVTGGAANNSGGVWGYGGAMYGGPPPLTGGAANVGGANAGTGGVMAVPAYGIPPIPDKR